MGRSTSFEQRTANGYVERAKLRISIGQTRRATERRTGWSTLLGIVLLIVGVACVLMMLLQLVLTR